ncbi:MAG: zinc ribbon domain-containing protein [Candidatus Heimdallarchaeaceae archaeon]|jgi:predicted amidophosphoribosyltransferase
MKCLACWEPISEDDKICSHCGTDQQDAKDYLVLALMKQQKKKVSVPESNRILDYVSEVDPDIKDEITISSIVPSTVPSQDQSKYQPTTPPWLGLPSSQTSQQAPSAPVRQQTKPKIGTIKCPNCSEEIQPKKFCKYCGYKLPQDISKKVICPNCSQEVQLKKFCKFCGETLQKECPECKATLSIRAKFCTKCGYTMVSQEEEEKAE